VLVFNAHIMSLLTCVFFFFGMFTMKKMYLHYTNKIFEQKRVTKDIYI